MNEGEEMKGKEQTGAEEKEKGREFENHKATRNGEGGF